MCIIIVNKNKMLSRATLENSFENNSDGAGMAYVENGVVKVFKELTDFDKFYKKYIEVRKKNKLPILLHFRITTHGYVDIQNTHPYIVEKSKLVVMHNGIIDIECDNKAMSDTWHFTREYLKPLYLEDKNFLKKDHIRRLLGKSIPSSKLAFLDASGSVTIINQQLGETDEAGNWYSNSSYKHSWSYPKHNYMTPNTYRNGNKDTEASYCSSCGCQLFGYERYSGKCSVCENTDFIGY